MTHQLDSNQMFMNDFCSGHLVINKDREIIFFNTYISNFNDIEHKEIIGQPISAFLTKASNIFLDTYIYPLLLNEGMFEEGQLSWRKQNGENIPVVVNIKMTEDGSTFWSLYTCKNRDKLYSELIQSKEQLETQTKELFALATTDPLTGLLNRRQLLAQALHIDSQMWRTSSTYAVLTLDIDFFKQVNDQYGHPAGDRVLVQVAKLLTDARRSNDLVARVGGEEFVVVLPDVDPENAFSLAEKIRQKVAKLLVDNIQITLSIGLAMSDNKNRLDFNDLLLRSDNALLESKKAGRNQTVLYNF